MSKYYLIGLPGAGKSTAGKELAKKLDYKFIDLDSYIEQKHDTKIPEIFEKYGEAYFRKLESKALEDFMNIDNIVVSCGGGIVEVEENKELMSGFIVYLNPPISDISLRLGNDSNTRPLMMTNTIEELAKRRNQKYVEFSNLEIRQTILSEVVKTILKGSKNK